MTPTHPHAEAIHRHYWLRRASVASMPKAHTRAHYMQVAQGMRDDGFYIMADAVERLYYAGRDKTP